MKTIKILSIALILIIASCKKSEFAERYTDPSKTEVSSIEKQYTGFLASNLDYTMPAYWNYFVVLRTTLNRYTQSVGWENSSNQYVPGAAGISDRWNSFYNFLAQFREFENIYAEQPEVEKTAKRIYMITALIYFYDHTHKVVDLHGDIPWSEAGKLSAVGPGQYNSALAKYDDAAGIYTKMLTDLKAFADELNTITVTPDVQEGFKTQDFINKGDVMKWKRYCNSLRIKLLTHVSGVPAFQSKATTEITAIVGNPTQYPIITTNAENAQINVYTLNDNPVHSNYVINSKGFQTGLEDWNGNIAGKVMIDHMKANSDPRLRAVFEPGVNAAGAYNGLDPLMDAASQLALINGGTLSIYNRSTISRNQYFPGMLINAAEINFDLAEAHLKAGNATAAKEAYNNGITQSIQFYYAVRTISNNSLSGALTPTNDTEIAAYLAAPGVNWDLATTNAGKTALIATQKWLHFNVIQPIENWTEIRRLNGPVFNFQVDDANVQKQPPVRWFYASSENSYNPDNYNLVKDKDNLTTKIFWDIN